VLRDRIGTLAMPIQVIWGEDDAIVPSKHAQGLPPKVKVNVLKGFGHMPQMEAAAEVNKLIEAQLG